MITVPLTSTMLGIFTVCRLMEETRHYNVTLELDLDPALSADAIEDALHALVRVQPALRLAFVDTPTPHGVLHPSTDLKVDLVHLRDRGASGPGESSMAWAKEVASRVSFDLSQPPLLSAALVQGTEATTLFLVIHHLVTDGVSIDPLITDLNLLLQDESALDADVSRREEALVREHALQSDQETDVAALKMWAERVKNTPTGVLHPTPERPQRTALVGSRRAYELTEHESAQLNEMCSRVGTTPFAFFTSVMAATIARHTGEAGAVIGTPLMARKSLASFELTGYFTNTLALPLTVDWDASFEDLLGGQAATVVTEVKRDARLSWPDVVRHLGEVNASAFNNVGFASMLAMQASTDVPSGQPIRAVCERGNGTVKLDFWVGATPRATGWLIEIETDDEVIPLCAAEALDRSFMGAAREALRNPALQVRDLFGDASLRQADAHDGLGIEQPATTLREWAEAALGSGNGDQVVISDSGSQLTRIELRNQSRAWAARLMSLGVQAGDTVAVSTSQLADTAALILAILRAGARYLPLDPTLPAARLAYMVEKSEARFVVGLEIEGATTLDLDSSPSMAMSPLPILGNDPDVYVMFTSGSTGDPKGVVMTDRPLTNLTEWQIEAMEMGPGTRFLQYAPLGFDVSFQEILPTILCGGTVVARGAVDRRDLNAILDLVDEERVTHVYLPVAALATFCEFADGRPLDNLRWIAVSGEQLTLGSTVRDFFRARPHIRLMNLYGPTETHAVTTAIFNADDVDAWPRHAPIGRPLRDVRALVVDQTGHLAPTGVPGELLLGGVCPAKEYVNDEEQTNRRFVSDQWSSDDAARCYRTGDVVLWSETDELVFLGRNDDQVKIRGHRVELGELEVVAEHVAEVAEAVAAVDTRSGDPALHLFVVAASDANASDELLRTVDGTISRLIPQHMRPKNVHLTTAMPRTTNGKFDRAALVDQIGELVSLRGGAQDARAIEVEPGLVGTLQEAWRRDLNLDHPVDPDQSLMALGAHSILLLQHVTNLQHELGARIRLLDFFAEPTVRNLARLAESGDSA